MDRDLLTTSSGLHLEGIQAQIANPGHKSSNVFGSFECEQPGHAGPGWGREPAGASRAGPAVGRGRGGGEGSRPHTHSGCSPGVRPRSEAGHPDLSPPVPVDCTRTSVNVTSGARPAHSRWLV